MRKQTRGQRGFKSVGARGAVGRPRPSLSPRHCARRPQPRSPSDPPLARTGHAPPATEHTSPPAAPLAPLFRFAAAVDAQIVRVLFLKKNKQNVGEALVLDSLEQKSAAKPHAQREHGPGRRRTGGDGLRGDARDRLRVAVRVCIRSAARRHDAQEEAERGGKAAA